MRTRDRWMIAMGLGLVGAATFAVVAAEKEEEGEQKISAEQVPAKAKEALAKYAGSHKVESYIKEKEYGVEGFEAAWDEDGKEHAVQVTADGWLLAVEQQVPASEVPPAVQKTAGKELGGAKDISYIRKMVVVYEVSGKVKGREKEFDVTASGKLAEEAEEHEKKEEK